MTVPMRFYAPIQVGRNRKKTPEGFLIVEGVPIARTGEMLYGDGETPVSAGSQGYVRILRDADEVFRDITIASVNGKPLVNDHPDVDVDPDNWRQLTIGVVLNPRRGEGPESEYLLGDVMITDKMGIDLLESGKKELSCGYDADYEELQPGLGRQRNIVVNHLALVDKGRCGPRCAIGDRKPEEFDMKTRDEDTLWTRTQKKIRDAFKTGNQDLLDDALRTDPTFGGRDGVVIENHIHTRDSAKEDEEVMDEDEKEDKKTNDRIARAVRDAIGPVIDAMDKRFKDLEETVKDMAKKVGDSDEEERKTEDEDEEERKTDDNTMLEGNLQMEAPPGTGDRAMKAKDSAYLADSFQDTIAGAEILVPGIRVPTYDRAASPKKTFDTICGLRRKALEMASHDGITRGFIDDALAGRDMNFKTADCGQVRTVFNAAVAMKKRHNNHTRTGDFASAPAGGGMGVTGGIKSPADLNAANRKRYETGK